MSECCYRWEGHDDDCAVTLLPGLQAQLTATQAENARLKLSVGSTQRTAVS